mmetsp:Transcript_3715/g.7848  ORF Transcript_3715/g.7848 Transcript_3715/m.7848 type:complete len:298 (+) Transcript_3715:62-955(+)|eukprot:CAMPEP_0119541762 /NCGR_PEP_ID=MMETSP1344-20130328/53162_1 /TAXON_ID=236787 /ORGANISM="Florenciella parvula, Strain CCMP2471" /LENGTH=297 /DNA_ID=CAMNT_0007585827 /DNA_START=39 /DNA_END=932 /DNA_ORIENTATION=-
MSIGFIGLGQMGGRMVKNLLRNGREAVVYDVFEGSVAQAVSAGASRADTVAEVGERCSTVITMLPSSPHVTEVYLDADGLVARATPETLFIDSSTIDPATSRKVHEAAGEKGAVMLDAPVSGGVGGAEAGTLTFMVGGAETTLDRAKPVLMDMGANIFHCGGPGTGEVAKLCNNLAMAVQMVGTAEALNMGENLGMDTKVLANIMNTSTSRCWSGDTYNPAPGVLDGVPASRGYEGGFASALMEKDLYLAMDAARDSGSAIPAGAQAHALYSLMKAQGHGDLDFGAVFMLLKGDLRR